MFEFIWLPLIGWVGSTKDTGVPRWLCVTVKLPNSRGFACPSCGSSLSPKALCLAETELAVLVALCPHPRGKRAFKDEAIEC